MSGVRLRVGAGRACWLGAVLCAALCAALSGCTALRGGPVAPWEKGWLALPEMGFESDTLRRAAQDKVYTSKESASGGAGVAGGGCGCN